MFAIEKHNSHQQRIVGIGRLEKLRKWPHGRIHGRHQRCCRHFVIITADEGLHGGDFRPSSLFAHILRWSQDRHALSCPVAVCVVSVLLPFPPPLSTTTLVFLAATAQARSKSARVFLPPREHPFESLTAARYGCYGLEYSSFIVKS